MTPDDLRRIKVALNDVLHGREIPATKTETVAAAVGPLIKYVHAHLASDRELLAKMAATVASGIIEARGGIPTNGSSVVTTQAVYVAKQILRQIDDGNSTEAL